MQRSDYKGPTVSDSAKGNKLFDVRIWSPAAGERPKVMGYQVLFDTNHKSNEQDSGSLNFFESNLEILCHTICNPVSNSNCKNKMLALGVCFQDVVHARASITSVVQALLVCHAQPWLLLCICTCMYPCGVLLGSVLICWRWPLSLTTKSFNGCPLPLHLTLTPLSVRFGDLTWGISGIYSVAEDTSVWGLRNSGMRANLSTDRVLNSAAVGI